MTDDQQTGTADIGVVGAASLGRMPDQSSA